MLKPLPMRKVRIIGLKSCQEEALKILQKEGVLHITPKKMEGLGEGSRLESSGDISAELVRIRGIKNGLKAMDGAGGPVRIGDPVAEAQKITIDAELLQIKAEKEALLKRAGALSKTHALAKRLQGFDIDFSSLPGNLDYALISVPKGKAAEFRAGAAKTATHAEWASADDEANEKNVILLAALPKGAELPGLGAGAEMIGVPDFSGKPKRILQKAEFDQREAADLLADNDRRHGALSRKWFFRCAAAEEALTIAADRAEISLRFGESRECFFLEGWMKEKDVEGLRGKMSGAFNGGVMVEGARMQDARHIEQGTPTVLENPKIAGPFQYLLEMMNLPQSGEIDPTIALLVFVPILYGMIMGDAGYALVSFILALFIRSKADKKGMMRPISTIWAISAVPGVVFGVLFDEYFGLTHSAILGLSKPLYYPLFHRMEGITTLLVFCIFAGMLHVAAGFVFGFFNEWGHSKKHAAVKLAWLLIEAGGALAVAGLLFNAVGATEAYAGIAMLAAGAIAVFWGEGFIGLFEIPGLASNIMSYLRIAAIGVAGVILAELINMFLMPDPKGLSSPLGIVVFAITAALFVAMHMANIAITMFESLVHGARLNFVEFFGKFFRGNGIRFAPFAAKRRYTAGEN